MSQQKVLNAERGAAARFLDKVLRLPQDQVFLMQFDMAVQVKQAFTANRQTLDEALAFVDTPTYRELRTQEGGGTLLYDAIVSASKDTMKSQSGRKALIVLTDGVDTGSEANIGAAIDAAVKADTLVYSILFSDEGYYGGFSMLGGGDGRKVLLRISKETGGSFFAVSKKKASTRSSPSSRTSYAASTASVTSRTSRWRSRSSARSSWPRSKKGWWYRLASDTGRNGEAGRAR